MTQRSKGDWAEQLALRYLQRRGLHYRHHQYNCHLDASTDCHGELDLVMQWGRTIIFVEVRYRQKGGALKSIDPKKKQRLRCCAVQYRQKQALMYLPARFDVVLLEGEGDNSLIHWHKNVFPVIKPQAADI